MKENCTCGNPMDRPKEILHRSSAPCFIKETPAAKFCKHNGSAHWIEGFGWKCDDCGGLSGNHGGAPGGAGLAFKDPFGVQAGGSGGRGRIVDPPLEKEWWEESFDKFNDFFDKYDSDNWFARGQIKLLIREVAAQSEKKGRGDAVDYILMNVDIGGLKLNAHEVLEAARSSEEGKTGL